MSVNSKKLYLTFLSVLYIICSFFLIKLSNYNAGGAPVSSMPPVMGRSDGGVPNMPPQGLGAPSEINGGRPNPSSVNPSQLNGKPAGIPQFMGPPKTVKLFGIDFMPASLCGVLTVLIVNICILMIIVDWKLGFIFGNLGVLFHLILSSFDFLVKKSYTSLPGILILISGLGILYFLHAQLKQRHYDANTDYLTKIPNRRNIMNQLETLVSKKEPFYFLYVDIDDFKYINDIYGHKSGNHVLQKAASYWKKHIRPVDFVGRLGGDEFCMIISQKDKNFNITDFIKNKVLSFSKINLKMEDTEERKNVFCSVGIASFPSDAKNTAELLKRADIALYKSKHDGKGKINFYNTSIEEELLDEEKISSFIRDGLKNEFFYMVYQPQYSCATKKLRGFESLIRFMDDKGRHWNPSVFIPAAEKKGLIFDIDYFVLDRVLKDFHEAIKDCPDLTVSVNISAKHISELGFVADVKKALEKYDFPPKNLEIEITEYSFINSLDLAINTLSQLKAMGIKIALDDFGTGYSSLSLLLKLPIDLLKIDKSIVDNIENDKKNQIFIEQIINIGHSMNFEVISEGIEIEKQISILKENHCDFIQGFLWGTPLSKDEALALAKNSLK